MSHEDIISEDTAADADAPEATEGEDIRSFEDLKGGDAPQVEEVVNREPVRDELGRSYATGKRKDATARVWVKPGSGKGAPKGDLDELLDGLPEDLQKRLREDRKDREERERKADDPKGKKSKEGDGFRRVPRKPSRKAV